MFGNFDFFVFSKDGGFFFGLGNFKLVFGGWFGGWGVGSIIVISGRIAYSFLCFRVCFLRVRFWGLELFSGG